MARPYDFVPSPSDPRPVRVYRARVGLLPLVLLLFFNVSGGAYGLEDLVGQSGAAMALVLLVVTPVLWSAPVAFMVAELAAAMPAQGGYYAWVKKGLGPFWGFQEGWWSWLNSFIDMAIYPVLFAEYLSTLLDQQFGWTVLEDSQLARWLVGVALIVVFALLNIRGVRAVGRWTLLFAVLVLTPFVIMSVIGIGKLVDNPRPIWSPFVPEGESVLGALGLGLFVVMWNYLGWDGASTFAGEVHNPRRTFPWALALAVPLVVIAYLVPVIAGLAATTDAAAWQTAQFPAIGELLAGRWLGLLLAVGGLVSAAGLYNALLLANSRVPFVLADDGYLPRAFARLHHRHETPWPAIVVSSLIYAAFTWQEFTTLVAIDVIVYAASLLLQFAALIALRRREPRMRRPAPIPGGWPGVIAATAAPVFVLLLAIAGTLREEGPGALLLAAALLATGPLLYWPLRLLFKRGLADVEVEVERG